MKHTSNSRRPRSRGNGKRHPGKGNNVESSGPEVKIRGSAQQILDKYLALARDASSAGDRIASEGYFQHAEHYHRILNPDGAGAQNTRTGPDHRDGQRNRDSGAGAPRGDAQAVVGGPGGSPEAPAEVIVEGSGGSSEAPAETAEPEGNPEAKPEAGQESAA